MAGSFSQFATRAARAQWLGRHVTTLHSIRRLPSCYQCRAYTEQHAKTFFPLHERTPSDVRLMLYGAATAMFAATTAAFVMFGRSPVLITSRDRVILRPTFAAESVWHEQVTSDLLTTGSLLPVTAPRVIAVTAVAQRIIRAAEGLLREHDIPAPAQWTLAVSDSPAVNAYCTLGGVIVVCTGLLDFIARMADDGGTDHPEAVLASVLAHEVAHALAQHPLENFSLLPVMIAMATLGKSSPLVTDLLRYAVQLPHSRMLEREADAIGMELLTRACYPPRASTEFFQGLTNKDVLELSWLSTHPSGAERLAAMRDAAQAAEATRWKLCPDPHACLPDAHLRSMLTSPHVSVAEASGKKAAVAADVLVTIRCHPPAEV